jgi:hypothetical protein
MSDFDQNPGAIDNPSGPGGQQVDPDPLPPGSHAGDIGGSGEPQAAELDLPGPDDPVAWSYVEPGTEVVGPGGERIGKVSAMLGTETEGIFHGVAVDPDGGGDARVVPADDVVMLTPSRVEVRHDAQALADAEVHKPVGD